MRAQSRTLLSTRESNVPGHKNTMYNPQPSAHALNVTLKFIPEIIV
jgi:hypothetical protein